MKLYMKFNKNLFYKLKYISEMFSVKVPIYQLLTSLNLQEIPGRWADSKMTMKQGQKTEGLSSDSNQVNG